MGRGRLGSERVVVSAPMSFSGAARRIWMRVVRGPIPIAVILGIVAVLLILIAWAVVLGWYLVFGLLLAPYRLLRRGSRKRKKAELQHREVLEQRSR